MAELRGRAKTRTSIICTLQRLCVIVLLVVAAQCIALLLQRPVEWRSEPTLRRVDTPEKGQHPAGGGPYAAAGDTLAYVSAPLHAADGQGRLALLPGVDILNLDLGFNRGKITGQWLAKYGSRLFVVGVEANPVLAMCAKLIQPAFDEFCQEVGKFRPSLLPHLKQYVVVSGALDNSGQASVDLWYDTNQNDKKMTPDEGTIRTDIAVYRDRKNQGTTVTVAAFPLTKVLDILPLPSPALRWGCLKVDIQGTDMQAIISGGSRVADFACLSMEVWGANLLGDLFVEPVTHMATLGLYPVRNDHDMTRPVASGQSNELFINVRFLESFEHEDDYAFCRVSDNRVSHADVRATVQKLKEQNLHL